MSSNIGTILSMLLVAAFILLGGDMLCLSSAYSSLDNTSNTISYLISKNKRTDVEYLASLEAKYNVTFSEISSNNPAYGEVVDFTIYKNYHPLILSSHEIQLTVSRTTVIGYYG